MHSDPSTAYQTGYFIGMLFVGLVAVGLLVFFIVALVKAFTRKTTGWIIIAVVMGLFGLITLVGGVAAAFMSMSGDLASKNANPTKVLTSAEGSYQISVPDSWVSMPNLNSQAEIGAGNGRNEHYVIVLIEDKNVVGADLPTYMKFTADRMTAALDQGHQGDLSELTISGYPAQRRLITGHSKGTAKSMNVVYSHTCLETDRHLVQILFWTLAGREDAALPLFDKVAATFRAANQTAPNDGSSSGSTVKSVTSPSATVKSAATPAH